MTDANHSLHFSFMSYDERCSPFVSSSTSTSRVVGIEHHGRRGANLVRSVCRSRFDLRIPSITNVRRKKRYFFGVVDSTVKDWSFVRVFVCVCVWHGSSFENTWPMDVFLFWMFTFFACYYCTVLVVVDVITCSSLANTTNVHSSSSAVWLLDSYFAAPIVCALLLCVRRLCLPRMRTCAGTITRIRIGVCFTISSFSFWPIFLLFSG